MRTSSTICSPIRVRAYFATDWTMAWATKRAASTATVTPSCVPTFATSMAFRTNRGCSTLKPDESSVSAAASRMFRLRPRVRRKSVRIANFAVSVLSADIRLSPPLDGGPGSAERTRYAPQSRHLFTATTVTVSSAPDVAGRAGAVARAEQHAGRADGERGAGRRVRHALQL